MIYFNSILGLPVIDAVTGLRISVVKDILFDEDTKKVLGILLEEKGLFNAKKYIPVEEIVEADKILIKVSGDSHVKELDKVEGLEENSFQNKVDCEVYQNNGKKVGYISDVVFNFETGLIDSFIISDGVVEDLISGRRILKLDKGVSFKDNKVYICDK